MSEEKNFISYLSILCIKQGRKQGDLTDFFFFFILWPHQEACGFLVPWPVSKPVCPALEVWSVNHWIAREIPNINSLSSFSQKFVLRLGSFILSFERCSHKTEQLLPVVFNIQWCQVQASLVAQWWRIHLPVQETKVWSLKKKMATHSSILAWEIPWTEEPGRLQSMGLQKSDMT